MTAGETITLTGERADIAQSLAKQRFFLRHPARDLTDEQAAERTTVSALSVGGVIKHVTAIEEQWGRFILEGPAVMAAGWEGEDTVRAYLDGFRMLPGETLAGLLARYDEVAARTGELVATADLDQSQPLPAAPWFEPGARWSARRVFLHILAETAQHAGHADIIRESLDGAKSMG